MTVDSERHEAVYDCGEIGRNRFSIEVIGVKLAVNDHKSEVMKLMQNAWIDIVDRENVCALLDGRSDAPILKKYRF